MQILFFGNCQVDMLSRALQPFNSKVEMHYAGSSNRVNLYDPVRTEELMQRCDTVIAQPIMNKDNPDNHWAMRERLGERVVFAPYIFFDGMFALASAPAAAHVKGVVGHHLIEPEIAEHGLDGAIARFREGLTDFRYRERYDKNVNWMRMGERQCDLRAVDFIEAFDGRAMLTHNHPQPEVFLHLARQAADLLDLRFDADACRRAPDLMKRITLIHLATVLTPEGIEELGLRCDPDPDWLENGVGLYRHVASQM